MLKFDVLPEVIAPDMFTYLVADVPFVHLISKVVGAGIDAPPLFFISIVMQLPDEEFLYVLVMTTPYCEVDGVAWADVSGATQYHTATADITAIAINNTVATTGENPFLI